VQLAGSGGAAEREVVAVAAEEDELGALAGMAERSGEVAHRRRVETARGRRGQGHAQQGAFMLESDADVHGSSVRRTRPYTPAGGERQAGVAMGSGPPSAR